jgi:hypothetical protein
VRRAGCEVCGLDMVTRSWAGGEGGGVGCVGCVG